MNDQQVFEREVENWIAAEAASSPPDQTLDHILVATGRKRPLPRWLALIKEPPMRISSNLAIGSPTARVAAIMVATLLLALMMAGAGIAGSRLLGADGTIVVDQDGEGTVTTIADAVEMAQAGDEIRIRPGTYSEAVVIDKDITLAGDGAPQEIILSTDEGWIMVIDGDAELSGFTFSSPSSDGVLVSGGNVVMRELIFDHVGEPFTSAPCQLPCWSLDIRDTAKVVLRDSEFIDGGEIIAGGGATVEIEGNTLSGGPHIALFELGPGSAVRNNTITGTRSRGIGLYEPTDVLISGNTITDTPEYGISIGWETGTGVKPGIVANTVSGSAIGMDVAHGAEPVLERNVLVDNDFGIIVRGSDAQLTANELGANGTGIMVHAGRPVLDQNAVRDGDVGLSVASAADPYLSLNSICDNDTNVRLDEGAELRDAGDNEICPDEPTE